MCCTVNVSSCLYNAKGQNSARHESAILGLAFPSLPLDLLSLRVACITNHDRPAQTTGATRCINLPDDREYWIHHSSMPTEPKRTTKETHPNLPPGLILDADGKVCKVCNSWQDWAKVKAKPKTGTATASGSGDSSGSNAPEASSSAGALAGMMGLNNLRKPSNSRRDCPPDTAQLGRSTWTFLHTTAAYYPLSASTEQQTQMRNLLSSLSILYPCSWCATDFQSDISANPPAVSGRAELSRWLCERHNEVNRKLGKVEFGCTEEKLGERWKDGPTDGRCD